MRPREFEFNLILILASPYMGAFSTASLSRRPDIASTTFFSLSLSVPGVPSQAAPFFLDSCSFVDLASISPFRACKNVDDGGYTGGFHRRAGKQGRRRRKETQDPETREYGTLLCMIVFFFAALCLKN